MAEANSKCIPIINHCDEMVEKSIINCFKCLEGYDLSDDRLSCLSVIPYCEEMKEGSITYCDTC